MDIKSSVASIHEFQNIAVYHLKLLVMKHDSILVKCIYTCICPIARKMVANFVTAWRFFLLTYINKNFCQKWVYIYVYIVKKNWRIFIIYIKDKTRIKLEFQIRKITNFGDIVCYMRSYTILRRICHEIIITFVFLANKTYNLNSLNYIFYCLLSNKYKLYL